MKSHKVLIFIASIIFTMISTVAFVISNTIGLGLLLGVTIILVVFFKPFYGLMLYVLMVYLMPHSYIRPLQNMRVMLLLAILILSVFFIHKVFRREPLEILSSRHKILVFSLMILVFISNIVTFNSDAAWNGVHQFLTVFFLFFIIVNLTENFDEFRKVCKTMLFCTVLLATNGLVMAFRGYDIMGNRPVNGRIIWTERSHFGDPNDFALALISFFPFILVNLFDKSTRNLKKIPLLAATVVLLMAIYYTNSRGGFVALMAILAFFSFKRWGTLKGIAVASVLMVLSVMFAPSRMSTLSPYEDSASGRIDAWIAGLAMLKSNPIFGIGYGNFANLHAGRTAHSAFVLCMAELGLIGYFVWLALLYSSYTGLRNIERHGTEIQAKYAGILQLSLIGFLFSAFFLSQAFTPILFILLALFAAAINLAKPTVVQPRFLSSRDIGRIVVLIVSSIIAFKMLAMVYF
jgi:putative inorganic carbon (HCO3(-)) transporter